MKKVIELQNIKRDFQVGEETVHALRGVSFTINEGEFVTIMGTSGSGKSTLLNTLGCLDTPTSGEYLLDDISVRTMSKPQRAVLRNRKIGFVFQSYNLLPKTTAVENVELPLMYNSSVSASERRRRAIEALQAVGLGDRLEHKSNQMSGGQQQRTAIGRAIVKNPDILICDEPTGALDYNTSKEILQLIEKVNKQYGNTIIIVTHNDAIKNMADKVVHLHDGRIRKEYDIEGKKVFIHVGRFEKQKNHNFIIDVFNEIVQKDHNSVLLLLGEGSLLDDIRQKVSNLNLDDCVKFLGVNDNINDFLSAADIMLFPSFWEGLPVSLVEAQYSKLKILCSDCISTEIMVTPLIHSLSLNCSAREWAEKALECLTDEINLDINDMLDRAGYNIRIEAEKLQDFYRRAAQGDYNDK